MNSLNNYINLKSITKNFAIFMIALVTVTSVKIQYASALSLLPPVPTFSTATQMLYDAITITGFTIPQDTEEEIFSKEIQSMEVKYTRAATVTAYNSVPWQTDSTPCISADGSDICKLKEQGEQSCAAALPFGTKINVPGFGVCTVRDRLAPKYSHRIDLYFGGADQIQSAKEWGKRRLTVEVLDS